MARDFVERKEFPAGPGPFSHVFEIPGSFARWTLLVVPENNDIANPGATDLGFLIEYRVGTDFFPRNPDPTGDAKPNQANTLTSEDQVDKVRVTLTQGGTPTDGKVMIQLNGSRVD